MDDIAMWVKHIQASTDQIWIGKIVFFFPTRVLRSTCGDATIQNSCYVAITVSSSREIYQSFQSQKIFLHRLLISPTV